MADKNAEKTEKSNSGKHRVRRAHDALSAMLRLNGFKRGAKIVVALVVIALPLIAATANYNSSMGAGSEPGTTQTATTETVGTASMPRDSTFVSAPEHSDAVAVSVSAASSPVNNASADDAARLQPAGDPLQTSQADTGAETGNTQPEAFQPEALSVEAVSITQVVVAEAPDPESTGINEAEHSGDPEQAINETPAEGRIGAAAAPLRTVAVTPTRPVAATHARSAAKDDTGPRKVAYITIDDGPSRAITPGILDVLKAQGVKATFFVLPHNRVDDIYQRIIDEGHELGNHSYSHRYSFLYAADGLEDFIEDVMMAQDFIFDNFGYKMTSFRFPGGSMGWGAATITPRREALRELGFEIYDWHADTGDARANMPDKSASVLTSNILGYTRDREKLIVLMHDTQGKRTTLEALPRIIAGLRAQGYTFDILRNYNVVYEPIAEKTYITLMES